jgi:integrase
MTRRSYGEGNIEKRGENRFQLRYRVNKKRFKKTFHGTLADAKKELRAILHSGDTGEHVAPDKGTLAEWAALWIETGAAGQKRRKAGARAIQRYAQLLRTHVLPTLGCVKLQQLDSTDIDKLYLVLEGKKIAPRTRRHVHSVFNACLGAAVRTKKLHVSPMGAVNNIPSPGESSHGIALDDEELRTLVLGFKGSSLFGVVSVAAFTGARLREILALRWGDLNAETKELRIERALDDDRERSIKGPKRESHKRTILIDDDLLALLLAERERHLRLVAGVPGDVAVNLSLIKLPSDALMFPNPPLLREGSFAVPRDGRVISRQFRKTARRLSFKLRFHDLRGTHETLLLDRGVPVHVVAARCGHDPAELLRSYAKRHRKSDTTAASIIGSISKGILGN